MRRAAVRRCSEEGCMSLSNNCGLCRKHYDAARAAPTAPECDCGATATSNGVCERCRWLDGGSLVEAEVIRHLQAGPATVESVANGIGYSTRAIYRALRTLRPAGHVSTIGADGEAWDRFQTDGRHMPILFLRERGAPQVSR